MTPQQRGGQKSHNPSSAGVGRRGRPVTCCEGLFGRVAGHVAPAGDEGHLVLSVWLQVPNGVLILVVGEIDGGAVTRHIFDPIG